MVRKYGFYYRFNYLTPTKKPIGWGQDKAGRRKRLYDKPQTPLDRLLAAGALAPAQERELIAYRDQLNPAAIAERSPTSRQCCSLSPRTRPSSSTSPPSRPLYPTSAKASGSRPADPRVRGHSYVRHRSAFAGILT